MLKGNAMEEKVKRLASLDALRGFDMFWIMGGDALLVAVLFLKLVPCDGFVRIASALAYVALCWLFLLWLYRRKVFLKI